MFLLASRRPAHSGAWHLVEAAVGERFRLSQLLDFASIDSNWPLVP